MFLLQEYKIGLFEEYLNLQMKSTKIRREMSNYSCNVAENCSMNNDRRFNSILRLTRQPITNLSKDKQVNTLVMYSLFPVFPVAGFSRKRDASNNLLVFSLLVWPSPH